MTNNFCTERWRGRRRSVTFSAPEQSSRWSACWRLQDLSSLTRTTRAIAARWRPTPSNTSCRRWPRTSTRPSFPPRQAGTYAVRRHPSDLRQRVLPRHLRRRNRKDEDDRRAEPADDGARRPCRDGRSRLRSGEPGQELPGHAGPRRSVQIDEHVCFGFFIDFVLRIHSFPQRDDDKRLVRVLDAIEKSAFDYLQQTGRPAVLVIDGINSLSLSMPDVLERIQEKAKLWADTNTVKLILINNDEGTESQLQRASSSWTRMATPIIVGDLGAEDAVRFLMEPHFMESPDAPGEKDVANTSSSPTVEGE